jgi:hypothetical protein
MSTTATRTHHPHATVKAVTSADKVTALRAMIQASTANPLPYDTALGYARTLTADLVDCDPEDIVAAGVVAAGVEAGVIQPQASGL